MNQPSQEERFQDLLERFRELEVENQRLRQRLDIFVVMYADKIKESKE
jgi:hypothetical protein